MTQLRIMNQVTRRFRAVARDRRANAAVEFALGAPVLFLFLFGIIEVGYALWMQNALDYSTASAARCASLNGNPCSGGIAAYAAGLSGTTLSSSAFSYSCRSTDACANNNVTCGCQVTGAYTIALDIPWDNALVVNLSSNACYPPPPSVNCTPTS
jgi:Flp pilus assembly protein TadG